MIREHGKIYKETERYGDTIALRLYYWCAGCGKIHLPNCDDFCAAHGEKCRKKADEIRQLETADFERMAQKTATQKLAA